MSALGCRQHWNWSEQSNAVLDALVNRKDAKPLTHLPADKVLPCWKQFLFIRQAIEGLPSSPLSLHVELAIAHNMAASLLLMADVCGDDPALCLPVNTPSHAALHVICSAAVRAVAALSATVADCTLAVPALKGYVCSASLSWDKIDAVLEEDVQELLHRSRKLLDLLSSSSGCTAPHSVLALCLCLSVASQCLKTLMFDHAATELVTLCTDILAPLKPGLLDQEKDAPELLVLGCPGHGVVSFWKTLELKSAVANSLCALRFSDSHGRMAASDFADLCARCGDEGDVSSISCLGVLKAWLSCRDGSHEQCLTLLDKVDSSADDTLRSDVSLLRGVCHLHLCQPHHALLHFKTAVSESALPSSVLAMYLSCSVFRRLGRRESELKAWKLLMKLYDEYRKHRSTCCLYADLPSIVISGSTREEGKSAEADSHKTCGTDVGILPTLSMHQRLYSVKLHLTVPHRLQLLQGYAECLFLQGADQDCRAECMPAYSTLLQALLASTSTVCSQASPLSSSTASCGVVALLEFAQALRTAQHSEDSMVVCTKILDFCSRTNSASSKQGQVVLGDRPISTGHHPSFPSHHDMHEVLPIARKRKHDDLDSVSKLLPGNLAIQLPFLEAAAWLCHGLNLQALDRLDQAATSLKSCLAVLEDASPQQAVENTLPSAESGVPQLLALKGQALYSLANLLHTTASNEEDSDIIEEHLQQSIQCCARAKLAQHSLKSR